MKKGNKAPTPVTISQQEAFWNTLHGDDLTLARVTSCNCMAELEMEKRKKEERSKKAEAAQQKDLRENERKRQWEKEQEKKRRETDREESKQKKQLEEVKKRAFSQGVVEAEDYGDGVYYVQCEDERWMEVSGQYFCRLCSKHLNDVNLEGHLGSKDHKKKVEWNFGVTADSAPPAPSAAPREPRAAPAPQTCGTLVDWQKIGADGLVRCIPCNKVVDDLHVATGDHKRKLETWRYFEKLKTTGYPAPELEYLAYVPSDPRDQESERWLKCLLCQKWSDEESHLGTPRHPKGSKEHQSKLQNYARYREAVLKERKKYHPSSTGLAPTSACSAQCCQRPPAPATAPPAAAPAAPAAAPAAPAAPTPTQTNQVQDETGPDPLLNWYLTEPVPTGQDMPQHLEALKEKLDERDEETHSDGDCGISSTTSSDRSPLRAPEDWTGDEVADWLWNLEGGKHRRYVEKFKANLIDGRALAELTLPDLKDLEVTELRNRKIMHQEIQKLFHS